LTKAWLKYELLGDARRAEVLSFSSGSKELYLISLAVALFLNSALTVEPSSNPSLRYYYKTVIE